MSRPPAVPNLLPAEQTTIYFVTFCTAMRASKLANPIFFEKFKSATGHWTGWTMLAAVVMPDHIHMLAAPGDRDASIKNAVAAIKRWSRAGDLDWKWQEGCFDRLLRRDESAHAKWLYMRENPVRAGLVDCWSNWPYQIGLEEC